MAKVSGTSGNDDLGGTSSADMYYAGAGDDTVRAGGGNDTIYAGDGDDLIYGEEGDDQLQGNAGDDSMYGGVGNDTYVVEDEGDQVFEFAGQGRDTVISFLDNYALDTNAEVLNLGGTGNFNGSGNAADNSIRGNSGNNNLQGRGGNDTVYGMGGDDVINGGEGDDLLNGGDGNDIVSYKSGATGGVTVDLSITTRQNTGSAGSDFLTAFESLEGTEFADTLSGNSGNNTIIALGGGDTIRGREGDDELVGGAGGDDFLFESASTNGSDLIRGFVSAEDDLVFRAADGYEASGFTFSGNQLFYDTDGAGGADPVLLATFLSGNANPSDIVIV